MNISESSEELKNWDTVSMGTLSQGDYEEYLKESARPRLHEHVEDAVPEDELTEDDDSLDIDWLREVGFDFLIEMPQDENDSPEAAGVMSTLTRNQAEAVRRRVEQARAATLNRRRSSKCRLPDVRDVFPTVNHDGPRSLPVNYLNSFEGYPDVTCIDGVRSRPHSLHHSDDHAPKVKPQSSVDEARSVYRSDPGMEEANKKKNWMDRHIFFRSGSHYKFDSTQSGIPISGTGVEVLSYNVRSSMKRLVTIAPSRRKPDDILLEENFSGEFNEDVENDQNQFQEFGFELLKEPYGAELPDVCLVESSLGVTKPEDLSSTDMKAILSLALISLTALFDEHDLTYRRRKPNKRKLKDGVFGVSLVSLVQEDRQEYAETQCPIVFQKLLFELERRALEEEGILRKVPSFQVVESLKELLESCRLWSDVDEALSHASAHDLAYLVKSFVRELPEPLLTNTYLEAFLLVPAIPDVLERLKVLNLLVILLPECHRETLKRLLDFMGHVSDNEASNRMSLHNLSLIMAPNLFPPDRAQSPNSTDDISVQITLAAISAQVTLMLCKYKDVLFTVPPCLLKQIRNRNEEANCLRAQKGRKKVSKKDQIGKPRSCSDPLNIEIQNSSPPGSRHSLSIQIECDRWRVLKVHYDDTTSVQSFLQRAIRASGGCNRISDRHNPEVISRSHNLHEVGGNIGELRQDMDAKVSSVFKNNPTAEWKIKCKNLTTS